LRQGFQEEAYEVLDALDREDLEDLVEELGDILLHVLIQAQIASELGEFRMSDIVRHVNTKIVHRHPHIFDGLSVNGVEEVLVNWEELKRQEKGQRASSVLDSVSLAMPALARAQSIQRHVDRTGLVSAEVNELLARVSDALPNLLAQVDHAAREAIFGDLLFELTNLARKLNLDAESALREANSRFERRFRSIENSLTGC
jgi:tetrapyrrole methylase family protein/MazG family protein